MNKRMILMLTGCAVLFGGIFGFKWFGNRMMNEFFDNMPVPAVTVSSVQAWREQWSADLRAVGTLQAVRGTEVTTEASGIVESIEFQSGDAVVAGAVLLVLDRATDEAELAALEARAELARQELERAENLYTRAVVARSELDRRQAEAAAARAEVEAQRARIAQKVIRAPFAGEIGIRRVDIGQHLAPGTPIVSLQSLDPIYVNFKLPQRFLAEVRPGLDVAVESDSFAGKRFAGKVTAIEPRIDASTRNFEAQALIENTGRGLRPGMFVHVDLALGAGEEFVVVPQTAISYNPYGNAVWVLEEDGNGTLIAERRLVTTGRRQGDLVAILEGLAEGEQVATSGLLKLRNNAPVHINNDIQPDAAAAPRLPNR